MSYRTMLVDLNSAGSVEARLKTARALASRFDATLVGLYVSPPPFDPAPWEGGTPAYIPTEILEARRKASQEAEERVRTVFGRVCGAGPAAAWREAEGDPGPLLAEAAHASDLVVTARGDLSDMAERLVTATGVPVLTLAPNGPRDFGRVVLVGWNGSREAARAAHDALPFLRGAERVLLCAVGERAAAGLEDAAAMLGRHQVPVRPERVGDPDAPAGEVLLERAAAHGADLLVMGAYGHSRLREMVFGGATRHVLREAPLPVLFSS
jgi:nucleotide-binding universal stress UspA family protein